MRMLALERSFVGDGIASLIIDAYDFELESRNQISIIIMSVNSSASKLLRTGKLD